MPVINDIISVLTWRDQTVAGLHGNLCMDANWMHVSYMPHHDHNRACPPPAPRNARHVAPAVPRLSQGRTFAATWTARRQRSQRRRQDELANEVRDCGLAHVDCREDLGDTDDDNEDAVCRDVEEGGAATSAL